MNAQSASTPAEDARTEQHWLRRNIEAFTIAIVMALVIKQFLFEAFQVPTPSMEPIIIGNQSASDRIIVERLSFMVRDPERFETATFDYPLSMPVSYIKRVLGLPGERIELRYGDCFAAPTHDGVAVIQRKPRGLQEELFRKHPLFPAEDVGAASAWEKAVREWWVDGQQRSLLGEQSVALDGEQRRLTLTSENGDFQIFGINRSDEGKRLVSIRRRDTFASKSDNERLTDQPSDLRLRARVRILSGTASLQIIDGTQGGRRIELRLSKDADPVLTFGTANDRVSVPQDRLEGFRFGADEREVMLTNVDDRITVHIDGEELLRFDYEQWTAASQTASNVSLGVADGECHFLELRVERDIYWTNAQSSSKLSEGGVKYFVPAEHYFCLGDNSPNSLDARGWRVSGLRVTADNRLLLGDMEAVSDDPRYPRRPTNPWISDEELAKRFARKAQSPSSSDADRQLDPETTISFLDVFGNTHEFAAGEVELVDVRGFGEMEGDATLLKLHGSVDTELPEAGLKPLTEWYTIALDPHAGGQANLAQLWAQYVHYVHRDDIHGRAGLVFWPPSRWGVIR